MAAGGPMGSPTEINWRKILRAYMEEVMSVEGVDFLPVCGLTDEEEDALDQISQEIYDSNQ